MTKIVEFLAKCHCPLAYLGREYLIEILCLSTKYVGSVKNNYGNILSQVQSSQCTNKLCIERNLRTLVDKWKEQPVFKNLFNTVPTNLQLIIKLTELITFQRPPQKKHVIEYILEYVP